jgi:hypothetical protein
MSKPGTKLLEILLHCALLLGDLYKVRKQMYSENFRFRQENIPVKEKSCLIFHVLNFSFRYSTYRIQAKLSYRGPLKQNLQKI